MNDPRQNIPRPWQPRIGIGTMLLLTLVVCVMGTAASYFVRMMQGGREFQLAFILFTLAAPLVLVVIVSVFHALFRRRRP